MMGILTKIRAFVVETKAATAIEYGLIAAIISVILAAGAFSEIADRQETVYRCAQNAMNGTFRNDGSGPCAPYETPPGGR